MFHVFILDLFSYALILCVLLFACTLHLMLYAVLHNEYMSTAVSAICIYSFVMSLCMPTYYAHVLLMWHTIVVTNNSYRYLIFRFTSLSFYNCSARRAMS